ncbi:MAG: class I SAM-dependent methyltransferase [Kiritimatiellae bacterium]|nr:class I SAM-dependent methyltransferase [Kiritimatiellia bacterium]
MDEQNRARTIEYYRRLYEQFGYSPASLDIPKGRQPLRYHVLTDLPGLQGGSILDLGCGFADLYDYLTSRGWQGEYVGYDVAPFLVDEARRRHPDLVLEVRDILVEKPSRSFDFIVASGVFNTRLENTDHAAYVERMVETMFGLATEAVSVNFLSTHVDFQKPEAFHCDPAWIMDVAARLSRRFVLRHDYFPFEFCVQVFKNQEFDRRRPVFAEFQACVQQEEQAAGRDAGIYDS